MIRLGRAALLTLVLAGCASAQRSPGDAVPRPAVDVPERFLVGEHDGAGTSEPGPGATCRNPLVDPRTGAKLTLLRSSDGRGDYEVPPERYGVREGEALRIECATGRAVGIVKRPHR